MAVPSPSTAATEAEWQMTAPVDLGNMSESGDDVEVDAVLARMDQLMHLVSVATSEEDKQSRQRFSRICRESMDKLWNDLPQGIVSQLNAMETGEEASGSEIWEPRRAEHKTAKHSSEGEEVVKLARLVFLQSMQLEVKGQRAFAAELQCKAMKDRALTAESYLSSLENELQIHKELVEELQVEKRSLVLENAMLGARGLEIFHQRKQPKPKEMGAEKLHREASELLQKLSRTAPSKPRASILRTVSPQAKEEPAPSGHVKFGVPRGSRMVQIPSVPLVPSAAGLSGAPMTRRHTLCGQIQAPGAWSAPEPRPSYPGVWVPSAPRSNFRLSATWPAPATIPVVPVVPWTIPARSVGYPGDGCNVPSF